MARTRNGSTLRQRVARYLPLRYNKLSCRCLSSLSPKGLVTWNRVPMCFTSTISKKGNHCFSFIKQNCFLFVFLVLYTPNYSFLSCQQMSFLLLNPDLPETKNRTTLHVFTAGLHFWHQRMRSSFTTCFS